MTQPHDMITARVELTIGGRAIEATLAVPNRAVAAQRLLPIVWALSDKVVELGIEEVHGRGQRITCKKGCGACCRQLVPAAEVETRHLREMVLALPEPRRSEILERFAGARRRLEEAGLLDRLLHPERYNEEQLRGIDREYWQLGLACPFLEEESCSIYRDRPLACREFLVTTPAEQCSASSLEMIRPIPLHANVARALMMYDSDPKCRYTRWAPLAIALEWAQTHPDFSPARPAVEQVQEFFALVNAQTQKDVNERAAAR